MAEDEQLQVDGEEKKKSNNLNGDGIDDLVLFDHGKKQEGHFSFTGSRPVVLLGSSNGKLINDTSISNAYMEILEEVHEGGPTLEDGPFSEWPLRCVTIDAPLVEIAKCLTEAARTSVPSRDFYCANSEATRSSGFHWVSCVLDISVAVAEGAQPAMEDA